MDNNSSSARILMKSSGETCKITGLALSTVSTLYGMKYLTTAGTSLIEFLPHLFNQNTGVSFVMHMAQHNSASWYAVVATIGILLSGIVIRKVGTLLSDNNNIKQVEYFMYNMHNNELNNNDNHND